MSTKKFYGNTATFIHLYLVHNSFVLQQWIRADRTDYVACKA